MPTDLTKEDVLADLGYLERYAFSMFELVRDSKPVPIGYIARMADLVAGLEPRLKAIGHPTR